MTTVNVPNASSVANASSFVDIGRHTGLRLALEVVTRETERQYHRAARCGPSSAESFRHTFAASVLEDVATQLAEKFRQ